MICHVLFSFSPGYFPSFLVISSLIHGLYRNVLFIFYFWFPHISFCCWLLANLVWSENVLYILSILLSLLKIVLWSSMAYSLLQRMSYGYLKRMYILLFGGMVFCKCQLCQIGCVFQVLYNLFYYLVLSITEKGKLKFLTILVKLCIFPFILSVSALCVLRLCCYFHNFYFSSLKEIILLKFNSFYPREISPLSFGKIFLF